MTARGNSLYLLVRRWPGNTLTLAGWEGQVQAVSVLGHPLPLTFAQTEGRVTVSGFPDAPPDPVCTVLRFACDRPPALTLCGGLQRPRVSYPRYDPCPSDLSHS